MAELTHVKGLKELQAFLDQLPAKMERNVIRGALRAGANVVKPAAQAGINSVSGALAASLRVSVRARRGTVTAAVKTNLFYARFVEYGTRRHTIKASTGSALAFGGAMVWSVDHPGTAPHPFMRPALDTRAGAAVVAAGEYIKQRLATKHGLDTADIVIEEE